VEQKRIIDLAFSGQTAPEINLIHQKYHDLKHQIALLRSTMPDEKRQAYLERMEDEISGFEVGANTGNHIVDKILMDKAIQCSQKGIKLNCAADGRLLAFMDPHDLSALLGNLLDNAIEHTEMIGDPAKRWIEFVIRRKNGFAVVGVGNCFEGEVEFRDGLPRTTKADERFHGYGTKSIKNTVARYDGTVNFSAENGIFLVKISFSLPET
jgi:sensor histidine kinase regulating citrate/malate metabolism